jgi:threonine/homoserine/homoserine lactone efflux protein
MLTEISFFISGLILGVSSGLTPGPLLTLVISETLCYGRCAGIKISISPLITDLPIILAAFFILTKIENISQVIAVIYFAGAVFLSYLAYENIRFKGLNTQQIKRDSHSLVKGVVTNFLNPSPYLFWFTIGMPIIFKALNHSLLAVILFIFSMYLFLVGSKIGLVFIIAKYRFFLKSTGYIYTIRLLGVVLFLFALLFVKEGLKEWFILSSIFDLFYR